MAIVAALSKTASFQAIALDLYVDKNTKQIFAEPGPNRTKLGSFVQVEQKVKEQADLTAKQQVGLSSTQQDLELKTNELKALEEHVVENREEKAKNDKKWFNKINLRGYTNALQPKPLWRPDCRRS